MICGQTQIELDGGFGLRFYLFEALLVVPAAAAKSGALQDLEL
jgi:hypothetical protein